MSKSLTDELRRPRAFKNDEIECMSRIQDLLNRFDKKTKKRMLEWVVTGVWPNATILNAYTEDAKEDG